jgi:hypothetical protein
MFRFLLIVTLIGWALYKLGLFRVQIGPTQNGSSNPHQRSSDGNINVDSTPKKPKDQKFKGGEYVDYEEVK